LVLCNIPSFLLVYTNPALSSITSILTSLFLILYFINAKPKQKIAIPFILFSILYFAISSFNYNGFELELIKEFVRFIVLILGITEVMYRSSYKELFYILLIGAISIILNALVFPQTNALYGLVQGRYSGFFLNPNLAGITCLLGIAISYSINNTKHRLIGQAIFTLAGILTLSRTFIVVWVLINILAVVKDRKNLLAPIIGMFALILVVTFSNKKLFAADRFEALTAFFAEGEVKTKTIKNDSRDQTWAQYYDYVFEKPFFGNGYKSFQVKTKKLPGAHNTFLMIIGESGIFPFLIFIGLYFYLFKNSLKYFKKEPNLIYILIVVLLNFMVSHTFFANYQSMALSLFIYLKIRNYDNSSELDLT